METHPERLGAPLTGDEVPPTVGEVTAEIVRCEIELMYAIARHRKAWSAMRRHREDASRKADSAGMQAYLDSDPIWKVKTGDVTWWRGEMQAQAAALQALLAMRGRRAQRPPSAYQPGPSDSPPDPRGPSVRTLVMGWDPASGQPPTTGQYRAAKLWEAARKTSRRGARPTMEDDTIGMLITAYRKAYADESADSAFSQPQGPSVRAIVQGWELASGQPPTMEQYAAAQWWRRQREKTRAGMPTTTDDDRIAALITAFHQAYAETTTIGGPPTFTPRS